jgi:hypothetical protein
MIGDGMFDPFGVSRAFVEPWVRGLRVGNTLLDTLFYDVNVLSRDLRAHGDTINVDGDTAARFRNALRDIDLSALADPEGSILIADARHAPYITPVASVPAFIAQAQTNSKIRTLSVTGVGSSALGSAAFAWNLSTALREPVAAIVPGYGMADVVEQALGGWFMGLHQALIKQSAQTLLASTAPGVAQIGRGLQATAPSHEEINGAPVFARGSGSADVLHDILDAAPQFTRAYGHSKGALVIESAIADLDDAKTRRLSITTFGCTISEAKPAARYEQFLGLIDSLGALNSWGNAPEKTPFTHHSTNTRVPFSMDVRTLSR